MISQIQCLTLVRSIAPTELATMLSYTEYTEAGLALRLVEELFEAQTLDGCRVVLDYLDCRHQFLTEVRMF